MRRRFACLFALAALAAFPASAEVVDYALDDDAAWLEGCIVGPCLCPIAFYDDLSGGFALEEVPSPRPAPWRRFELRDFDAMLRRGQADVAVAGEGFYETTAPTGSSQRLVLDLTLDGDPLDTLDSGSVASGAEFPAIEVQALTPQTCFQEGVWLAASPVAQSLPEPSRAALLAAGVAALLALRRARAHAIASRIFS